MVISKKFSFEGAHIVRNCSSIRCKKIYKNINDEHGVIKTIKFIKEISKLNKEIECLK